MSDWWAADPVSNSPPETPGRLRITVNPASTAAITANESGGNYRAIGPQTRTGDRAFGRYQVMGQNIGPWSEEVLGRKVSIGEFVNSPEIQDQIFQAKFGAYEQKYGPEGAARAWFAGEGGMNDPNRRDILGTSVADYSRKFMNVAGGAGQGSGQGAGWWANDPVASPAQPAQPIAQPAAPNPVAERSGEFAQPQNADALRAGLQKTAGDLTRGPETSPGQRIALDFMNQGSAASQGTTPNIDAQQKNLISTQVFESDTGEVLYRDPATGQVVPTDQNKHVVLRDPRDNTPKVYARTSSTDEGRLSSAGRILGTGMATGAPTLRPSVPAFTPSAPTREQLLTEAKKGFEAFRNSGVEVPGAAVKTLSQEIGASLNTDGFLDVLAPKTFGVLSKLEAAPDGSTVGAAQLHAIRRTLGRVAASPDPTEKAAATTAMSRLDEFLGTIPEAQESLSPAIGNYAAAKRSQAVGTAEGRAELNAASAGSGANIDNTTRQAIKAILKSPKQLRGFSGEEIAQMNQIVRGTFTGNAARLLGKLAPTGVVSGSLSGGGGRLPCWRPCRRSDRSACWLCREETRRHSDCIADEQARRNGEGQFPAWKIGRRFNGSVGSEGRGAFK